MKSVKGIALLAFAVALAVSLGVPGPAPAQSHPCADDIAKFCSGVQRGSGRIRRCLRDHEGDLSAACQTKLQAKMAVLADRHRACGSDAATLCSGIKPGGGRVRRCLHQHAGQLSSECAATF